MYLASKDLSCVRFHFFFSVFSFFFTFRLIVRFINTYTMSFRAGTMIFSFLPAFCLSSAKLVSLDVLDANFALFKYIKKYHTRV